MKIRPSETPFQSELRLAFGFEIARRFPSGTSLFIELTLLDADVLKKVGIVFSVPFQSFRPSEGHFMARLPFFCGFVSAILL
jgi:hypothetical protein